MENLEPRVPIVFIEASLLQSLESASDEVWLRVMRYGIVPYNMYKQEPTNLQGLEKTLVDYAKGSIDHLIEKYLEKKSKGGQPGNNNASKDTNKNGAKTNKTNNSFVSTNTETNNRIAPNYSNKESCSDSNKSSLYADAEEEDNNSTQGASNGSSSDKKGLFLKGQFIVDNYIKGAWNLLSKKTDYMKQVSVIGDTLRDKLQDRYTYLLQTFNGDENKAKQALVDVVRNVADSAWFEKNKGKATIDWCFHDDDTVMKILNKNYNDD